MHNEPLVFEQSKDKKTLIFLRLFLFIVIVIFFLPLFILPFYNHACTDDYFCGYNLNNLGSLNYQKFIYNECGGRFSATFFGSLFAKNGFLYQHYYLHSLLFLTLNIFSTFFLLRTINKNIFKEVISKTNLAFASIVFVALTICDYPEFSTFNFWFSSAITYQLPIILFQIIISFVVILFFTESKWLRSIFSILIPILIFIVTGFNELFIVVNAFLLFIIFYLDHLKKLSKTFWILSLSLFIISAAVVILSPGSHVRAERIVPKNIYLSITAVCLHMGEVIWNILRNPFSWLILFLSFYYGTSNNSFKNHQFITRIKMRKWHFPIIISLFLFSTVSFAVAGLKGGLLPDRYLNGVTYFTLLMLICYSFLLGATNNNYLKFFLSKETKHIFIYIFLIIVFLCNSEITDEYKSLISAPVYDQILKERENTLSHASSSSTETATIKSYDVALTDYLKKYEGSTKTFYKMIQEKPKLLFFEDDLANNYSINILKQYYNLNSIIVMKK